MINSKLIAFQHQPSINLFKSGYLNQLIEVFPIFNHRYLFITLIAVLLQGCGARSFMPTPNLFIEESSYLTRADAPNPKSTDLEILYVTDRLNRAQGEELASYGKSRSSAAAFGEAIVKLNPGKKWEELRDASDGKRGTNTFSYGKAIAKERGSFPDSPYLFTVKNKEVVIDQDVLKELDESKSQFKQLVLDRMKKQNSNEVVLYVHGFANSFEFAAQTLSGIWHFLEREHVPILYSWPAGAGGLRGYFVDTVSGDFTIFHLKETLRVLFDMPEVEKIHIIGHSRGTAVVTTALRELLIETRGNGQNVRKTFRIENLILAAPDLDFGVIRQRLMAEAFGSAFGQINVYTTSNDKALSISQLLQRGIRFGLLASKDLDTRDRSILERVGNVHFIQAQDIRSLTGHDYFVTDPAVSSDLLSVIKHSAKPGSKERPLTNQAGNFWLLPFSYPNQ